MKLIFIILFFFLSVSANSQNWFSVEDGIHYRNSTGAELISFDNKLFAGGIFDLVDNMASGGIAYWDDKNWKTFTTERLPYRLIRSFAVCRNELYGFGYRNSYSEIDEMVKYDTKGNTWIGLPNSKVTKVLNNGNIISGIVSHSVEFQGNLYIAGYFDFIGDKPVKNIAKWNGSEWSKLANTDENEIQFSNISDLIVYNDKLFVSGVITNFNNELFREIASWDGNNWDNLNGGLIENEIGNANSFINKLEVYKGELYAAGRGAIIPGNDQVFSIVKWDGNYWKGVEGFEIIEFNINFGITALKTFGNYLVIGTQITGETFLYDQNSIKKIDQDLNGSIKNYEVFNNQLYAGGSFGSNSIPNSIAKLGSLFSDSLSSEICNLFPNPNNGEFMLKYNINENSKTIITLLDTSGKLVKKEIFNDLKGNYLRAFNLLNSSAGIYIIKIQSKEINEVKTIVKY